MSDNTILRRIWNEEQRRIAWTLICHARKGLKLDVNPCIATAFVFLHRYFRNSEDCSYELFILLAAALFTACKAGDSYRPLHLIYQELSRTCQALCRYLPINQVQDIIGERDFTLELNKADFMRVQQAEMDILQTINFDFDVQLPFEFFNRWKHTFCARRTDEELQLICNRVLLDLCLMMSSDVYLDVPPEVSAAAATEDSFNGTTIPSETFEWLRKVKTKYGEDVFDLAVNTISSQKQKTAAGNKGK